MLTNPVNTRGGAVTKKCNENKKSVSCVTKGRQFGTQAGQSDEITIENGTQGETIKSIRFVS